VDIYGYDYKILRDLAVRMAQFLESIPGLTDVKLRYKPGRPEVRIEVDRERASLLGFSIQDIAESLHAQIRGLRATYFLTQSEQVETVARLQEQYRKTLGDVEALSLVNPRGDIVPLHQFVNIAYGLTPSEVWRKNRERMIQVSANRGDVALGKVADIVLAVLPQIKLPTGYYYQIGGDYTKMVETEKESTYAFVMMVLLIYVVLASLFESYTQPLVILIAIPFTLIGAFPLLWITKTPVTIGALIGMIMLGGIAVKNSIMLIDVFNRIREEKRDLRALLQAGQERIRPIVMTTLTTVLGMAPMIFEKGESGSLWKPMAITITGGLIVSTILVLFVIPAFYLILQDCLSWLQKKFHFLPRM
jgi:HAE1 family hydrophobic/amphiphilic exporter-1